MVRCNMLRRWLAIGQAIGQAIDRRSTGDQPAIDRRSALVVWAICFCVANIANATIGVLVIAKRVAPCARSGGASIVMGIGHWSSRPYFHAPEISAGTGRGRGV